MALNARGKCPSETAVPYLGALVAAPGRVPVCPTLRVPVLSAQTRSRASRLAFRPTWCQHVLVLARMSQDGTGHSAPAALTRGTGTCVAPCPQKRHPCAVGACGAGGGSRGRRLRSSCGTGGAAPSEMGQPNREGTGRSLSVCVGAEAPRG